MTLSVSLLCYVLFSWTIQYSSRKLIKSWQGKSSMQYFKFVNWWIRSSVFWCPEQVRWFWKLQPILFFIKLQNCPQSHCYLWCPLKVGNNQKVLMWSSYPQIDEQNYYWSWNFENAALWQIQNFNVSNLVHLFEDSTITSALSDCFLPLTKTFLEN